MVRTTEFQTEVLSKQAEMITHLEYIKKKQGEHDDRIALLIQKFDRQVEKCECKFDNIDKEINWAKGFSVAVGSIFGAIGAFIFGLFGNK